MGSTAYRGIGLAALFGMAGPAAAQDVIPDGRTNTSVTVNGLVSDVRTGTISGGVGVNTLRQLNASSGRTVNIHVPQGTDTTVNLVSDRASRIDGTLNSVMNGSVGGTMIVANPNGVIVGAGGQINAGGLSVSTPSREFVEDFVRPDGSIDTGARDALIDGTADLAPGDIVVDGAVTARDVALRAGGDILVGGTIDVGAREALVGAFANTGTGGLVAEAGGDIVVDGRVTARDGQAGAEVALTAGRDITVSGRIDADGVDGADAGRIDVLAQRHATIAQEASVTATSIGAGAGGEVHFSGLKTVTVIGELSAAAQGTGALGHLYIDPETLTISENQLYAGQDTVLEASDAIYVRSGVILSTQRLYDEAEIDAYYPTLLGDSGDLTLRAPIIDMAEGSKIIAEGGRGFGFSTFYSGGSVLLEAVADQTLDTAGIARASTAITLGNDVQIKGGDVTIRAVATAGFAIDDVAQVDAFATDPLNASVTDLVNDAAAFLTGELASIGATVLPARAEATATIHSNADTIESDFGDVTIEALATTDVDITPDANMLAIIGVSTDTQATITFGANVVNNFDYGTSYANRQELRANRDLNIRAIAQETQSLSARAEGAAATAAIVSQRDAVARVTTEATPSPFAGQVDPWVELSGGGAVAAETRHDLDFDAEAANGGASGLALAGVVSLGDGEAIAAGNFYTTGGLDLRAETVWSRYDVDARGVSGDASEVTGDAQARDSSTEEQADIAEGASAVETLGDQDGTASDTVGGAANLTGGFVLTLHDDITAAGLGGVELPGPDFRTFGTEGGLYSSLYDFNGAPDVTITARTRMEDVDVSAISESYGAVGIALAGTVADWGVDTIAQIDDIDLETSGAVTVLAETLLAPEMSTSALDAARSGIGAGAASGTVSSAAGLPDADTLVATDAMTFSANATGSGGTVSGSITAAVTTLDIATSADVGGDAYLKGPYNYEDYGYGDYGYGDGYGYDDGYGNWTPPLEALSGFSLTARNAGAVSTRANDPARLAAGATTGIGAGVAVSDVTAGARATSRGNITTFGLELAAEQALEVSTLASAGAGGTTVDLAGAFALTRYTAQTDAWLIPGSSETRFAPELAEADRPEGGALRIRATDATDVITLAGALTDTATVGVGASAALTILDRHTRAALGQPDDLAYVGTGPYAQSSPIFAREYDYGIFSDGLSVAARTDGIVISAASAGTRPQAAAQGDTRSTPASVGDVSLSDADLSEETVQTGEDGNPAEGARAGFSLSGAYAGTFGTVDTLAYLGHAGDGTLDGDLTVTAEDASDTVTLTGASVPGDVTVGIAGGMAHDALARSVATSLVGGGWTAEGFAGRALLTGRSLTIAGGAGGEGGGALGVAGALALQSGSRTATLDIGAMELRLSQGTAALEATDGGEITTVAGAAQDTADASVGIGAAVALDRSTQAVAIEIRDYVQPGTDAGEFTKTPRGTLLVAAASLSVDAHATGTRTVLARSSGAATGLAGSGAVAIRTGSSVADILLGADMALAADTVIAARVSGDSVVEAGSTASGATVGVGVAFALQAEDRASLITLDTATIGGAGATTDVEGFAGSVALDATTSGRMRAQAIAGAAAPDTQSAPAEEGEDAGGAVAFNGSVALVTASDSAAIRAEGVGYGASRIAASSVSLDAIAGADMVATAGGLTQAGEGIGAGLGSALLVTDSAATIALRSLRIDAAGDIGVTARTDGMLDARAVNGSEQGFVNVGVNVAGGTTAADASISFGDLSAQPDDGDLLQGDDVTIRAEVANAHVATASSAAPVGDDGSASVNVGLAGFGIDGGADVALGGGDIRATGSVEIRADATPTVSASSLGADNLRLDFATNEAEGEGEGEADSGFNLGIAASLSDIDLDATVSVRATDIQTSSQDVADRVSIQAASDVTSSTAGLVDTSALVEIRENALILGPEIDIDATSRSAVRVDGTVGETNYGTDARSEEQANADLVDEAGSAARGDEAERTAFSASISPESATSAARVDIVNGIVGATVGDADIASQATTDITLGATDAPISATIAVSEVSADTRVTDSAIGAIGNLSIGARAVEDHTLTARVGAADASAVDAAAVVSIRRSRATALVDNAAQNSGLFGDVVTVEAATDRTLTFDADAVAGDDTFLAMAGNIGFGEGLTSAGLGGIVSRSDGTAADGVVVDATATTTLDVQTRAAGGRTTAAPEGETDKGGSDGIGARLAALGDDVNEDAETEADDGTNGASGEADGEGTLADAVRLAGAVTVLRQEDVTHATLGGTAIDADGSDLALGTTTVTAADVDVTANTTLDGMKIRTQAFLGEREEGDPNGVGVSAALGYVALDFDTQASLGQNATVTVTTADVAATTNLDPEANTDRAAALRKVGEGADADDTFETTPNNSAPALNGDIADGDWSISQGAAAAGEDVTVGVEAGIVNVDLTTSALLAGDVIGSASVTARTVRGLSAEVGRPTYLVGTDGAGVGIGGAVAITAWDERTRADIVDTASITGSATAEAESATRLATLASSKGAASSVGVNGALAILSLDRDVQAVVDPRAGLTGALAITATDRSQSVTSALASTTGEGVTIGASAALAFDDSRTQAVFGTLAADGTLGGQMVGTGSAITTLDITATDSSIRSLSAASGTGPEADDGETETAWGVGTVLGQDLDTEEAEALSGETEDTAGSGEAGYGLGISGAFALDFGDTTVDAASIAWGEVASGDVTIAATSNGLSTTATGAMVEGADTNGIAGAASIGLRDQSVSARLSGMGQTGTGTVDIRALATNTTRTLAAGQQGRSDATFRVAGSAALNLGATSVLTNLGQNTIEGERSVIATARSGGEITTLAGVRQQGGGTSVGVSFALDEHDTDASVELLGSPAPENGESAGISNSLDIRSATITATTNETRTAKAQTAALALPDADAGASVAVAAALVTAGTSGTVTLDRQQLSLTADSTVEAVGGGTTQATAVQLQGGLGEQPRVGGAAALVTGSRDLTLTADRGLIGMTGGTLTGGARDTGQTGSDIYVLTGGQGTGVAASSALTLGRGTVSVSLGSPTTDGNAQFGLLSADLTQDGATLATGLVDLTALDARDYDATSGSLSLQSGGAQVGVGTATTVDTREVTASGRDVILFGNGDIGLHADRSGSLTAHSGVGGVNASGAAVNVNGATVVAGGSIRAEMLGARSFFGTGTLSVTATDTGLVAARMLDVGFSSNTAVGAQVLGSVLRRDVSATVDVSDTQASQLSHAVTVAATSAARVEARALSANAAATAGVNATYRMLTADRDTSATLGGELVAPSATVTATRADALDTLAVDVAVSGNTSVGAKFTLIQQGGGTTANFGPVAGSEVTGAVTVAASDDTTISADSYAASVGSTVGAFGEGVLVILGGDGATADPAREGELVREEESELDALRAAGDAATQQIFTAGTAEAPEAQTAQPLQPPLGDGLVAATLDLAGTGDVTLGALDMDATVGTGVEMRVGTVGVGGTASAGAVAAMGIARTQAQVDLDTSALAGTLRVGGTVDLDAANTGDLSVTSVGVAVGGTAGATGSFAMALDRRQSGISLDDATIEAGSLSATAITSGEATARGLIAAAGGSVGAGAGVALSLDDRDTTVTADRATIDVLSGDLTLAASGGA
ncbi:leukotoxin LktA family filamentous adhesin, partial [Roseobacter sp. HKCCA0434]|uniref:leukotoxin LktA family filamentous adhesin n=1 Tax=Roseobacter sp. HKCCA0434 TaxID=3079297 RepID=UPI00290596EB